MERRQSNLLERHGRRMARARWAIIPLWLLLIAAAVVMAGGLGDVTTKEATLPGSEAQRGVELIRSHFSDGRLYTDVQPVFRHPTLKVGDPAYRSAATAALARAARVVPGTRVTSYFSTGSRDLVGQQGHLTFATLSLPVSAEDAAGKIPAIRRAVRMPTGFRPTLVGGEAADAHDQDPIVSEDLAAAERYVLPAALLLLLFFFGSAVSTLVPLLLAAITIVLAFAGTALVGQTMPIAEQVTNVITLVGLAIGVDYALLMVSRFREEMRGGADRVTATGRTMATAGRAVLLAGFTVAVGLAVLIALPVPFIRSMGVGGMLVPASAVLASLTLLPAVLCALGPRIDGLRVYPRRWRLREGALWGPLARAITGWAIPIALLLLVGLGGLAAESRSLSLHEDALQAAPKVESVAAARLVRAELGGAANPDVAVVDTGQPGGAYRPQALASIGRMAAELRAARKTVSGVTWPRTYQPAAVRGALRAGLADPTGRYVLVSVAPRGDERSASARRLNGLARDRADDLERALPGSRVTLTGAPAVAAGFDDAIYTPFPWLVAGVLLLTFAVLARAFRSWRVPIVAVLASGLSLLVTYGVLNLVFQRGMGAGTVGLDGDLRGIASWVPVFVFAFLFGISMDYEVFLLERVREMRERGEGNRRAVELGLRGTGRIIVTAAAVMVVAFAGFAAGRNVQLKEFGVALAVGVAVDALLLRCLVVPALMRLGGERNWRPARRRPSAAAPPTIEVDSR